MARAVSASRLTALLVVAACTQIACSRKDPPKQYPLKGQILAVATDQQMLTIKHEDIPNFMPAMTMTYPVAAPALMAGRVPGEIITATLEVEDFVGRLTAITH